MLTRWRINTSDESNSFHVSRSNVSVERPAIEDVSTCESAVCADMTSQRHSFLLRTLTLSSISDSAPAAAPVTLKHVDDVIGRPSLGMSCLRCGEGDPEEDDVRDDDIDG